MFSFLGKFFKGFGKLISKALQLVQEAGLTDEIVEIALPLIRIASVKFVDNPARREWVVAALMARRIPEGVARIAVEFAYKIYRRELEELLEKAETAVPK